MPGVRLCLCADASAKPCSPPRRPPDRLPPAPRAPVPALLRAPPLLAVPRSLPHSGRLSADVACAPAGTPSRSWPRRATSSTRPSCCCTASCPASRRRRCLSGRSSTTPWCTSSSSSSTGAGWGARWGAGGGGGRGAGGTGRHSSAKLEPKMRGRGVGRCAPHRSVSGAKPAPSIPPLPPAGASATTRTQWPSCAAWWAPSPPSTQRWPRSSELGLCGAVWGCCT